MMEDHAGATAPLGRETERQHGLQRGIRLTRLSGQNETDRVEILPYDETCRPAVQKRLQNLHLLSVTVTATKPEGHLHRTRDW